MGLLDKLLKKGPKADSVSKGGSPIYHYDEKKDKEWRPPQAYGEYGEEITRHFGALFPDREEFVFHEILSDLVHIDVNIMRPREDKPYYVMYTTGMSDLPMTLPEEIAHREDLKYGELFMFLPKEWNPGETGQLDSDIPDSQYWPIRLIKYLARFPHEYGTWLDWGHTIP
ncbi:suppressor of fused domain protein, partial [Enterocloster citroniae]|uniref:suppressor of fused domain protein n=1 Tax=Enterocloster citroniae TaxID=358743 RepID=UPI0030435150|nr:suppressor of fused domain protein [Enterocloster citroniae]